MMVVLMVYLQVVMLVAAMVSVEVALTVVHLDSQVVALKDAMMVEKMVKK
jgi:hypothetical protein